jgi:hypothetical protein
VVEHPEEERTPEGEPDLVDTGDQDGDVVRPQDGGGNAGGGDDDDDGRNGDQPKAEGYGEDVKVGKRIRKTMRQRLQEAIDALKEIAGFADYEDHTEDASFMDLFKSQDAGMAVKTVNGVPWLVTFSTNAFKDRQDEMFSTESLERYVKEAEKGDDRGTFDFWHVPGSDFADKEWQGVVGRFLVEAGPFKDTPVGKKARAFFTDHPQAHPTIAPEGWGCSPQFRYLPEDRKGGTYHWIWVMKTSILPRAAAANVWTKGEVSMAKLSDEQRKAAAEIFGEDFVKSLEEEGERRTKELEEAGVAFKADKWAKAKAALKELADEAEGEALAKALKKMADELDDEQALKSAKQLRSTAKKMGGDMAGKLRQIAEMLSPDDEEEPPEEEEKPEAKKEAFDLPALVEQLTAALASKIDPVAQAVESLNGRIEALERGEAQKAALTPRRAQRATESRDTEIADDDPLMAMKTRENERREGTLANSFFPKK